MEHCNTNNFRQQSLYQWVNLYLQQHTEHHIQTMSMVSGDASFRRYFRIHHAEGTYIAVDAPPQTENSRAFVAIAQVLYQQGVSVPQVIAYDFELGFMLLSDLGDTLLRPCLTAQTVDGLYQQAMREILLMQPCSSSTDYLIPPYDQTRLLFEMSLFKDWFVAQYLALSLTPEEIKVIDDTCQQISTAIAEQPTVFVHRDFHSRNLMLLANGKLGVIDFQDALMGAITYDLVSLLRDAYVEWPNEQVVAWVEDFRQLLITENRLTDVSQKQFLTWFDWMGAQRHLKVLGIFARLSIRDGKHGYLNDIPLVFKYLLNEIKNYPEFVHLNQLLISKILPSYLVKNPQAAAMLGEFVQ